MTTVPAVGSTGSTGTTASTTATGAPADSSSSSALASLNVNFTTMLKILTTQLQNQDPTNATDPNQFTQELVQMTGVQQQIATNQDLTNLVNAQSATSLATGVGYIGNYVEAKTTDDHLMVQGGTSEFSYSLSGAASNVTIQVQDASGNTVNTLTGPGSNGANYVSWNGQDSSGNQLPDGLYSFNVTATNAGNPITVSSATVLAKVTGVQSNSDGTLSLIAGNLGLASTNVNAVFTATALPASTALTEKAGA